jgi:hypothetical protein
VVCDIWFLTVLTTAGRDLGGPSTLVQRPTWLFRWRPFLTTDVCTLWFSVSRGGERGESTLDDEDDDDDDDDDDILSGDDGGTGDSDDVDDELEDEVLL